MIKKNYYYWTSMVLLGAKPGAQQAGEFPPVFPARPINILYAIDTFFL